MMLLNPSTSSSINQPTSTTTTTANKRPKLSLQTTALPPRAYATSISSFSPSSAHRATSRFSFKTNDNNNNNANNEDDDESVIPYPQPRGNVRSILRNSPYGRLGRRRGASSAVPLSALSASAVGAETKHVFFPPRKKVRFAARLAEVIPRIAEEEEEEVARDSDDEVDTPADPDAGDLHGKKRLLIPKEPHNEKPTTTSASTSSNDSDEWKKKRWCQKRTITWRWTLDDDDDDDDDDGENDTVKNKVRDEKKQLLGCQEHDRDIPPAPSL